MRKLKTLVWSLGLASVLLLDSRQAKADLITNGGFETGNFAGWTTDPNPSFPQYIVGNPVHSGTSAAQIAGYSFRPDTLSQTITTTLGQKYELSFWRYQAGGGPTISLTAKWDGTTVFSELNPGAQPYQNFTAIVTGTGSDTLLFTSANDPAYTYLDDVSLNAVNAVPEPTSFALLGTGAIGVVVAAIRRRRQRAI